MPEPLKDFISNFITLPEGDWEIIQKKFNREVFKKNEIILEEGKICRYFYFLERGLIRFYCNVEGNDITKMFCVAPYCFTSKVSFRNQSAAGEGIQALTETIVWKIDYTQYKNLEKINSWNVFMRSLLNDIQEFMDNRLLESKVYTAEENYKNLMKRYPGIMAKIPLKHLASFLGVAPQSLSRIRNNLYKNERS
ncbi:MAG: Crp/Fnr family transcriptional regulator [Prolixibacteraceae bacterium]|nr:Crp/Fnr family transcriptional regulator [Prolixibacteraceae bacterium]